MLKIPGVGRKSREKLTFTITIHHLTKVPKNSVLMYVQWKRGRKNVGETQRTLVKDKTAVWEQDFTLKSTLFRESEDKFKKKWIYLYVREVQKETKSFFKNILKIGKKDYLAKISINLADYAPQKGKDNASTTTTHSISFWGGASECKVTIKAVKRIGSDTDTNLTTDTDASQEDSDDGGEEEDDMDGDKGNEEIFPVDKPNDKPDIVKREFKDKDTSFKEPSTHVRDKSIDRSGFEKKPVVNIVTDPVEKNLGDKSSSFKGMRTTPTSERKFERRRNNTSIDTNIAIKIEAPIELPSPKREEIKKEEEPKREEVTNAVIQQELTKLSSQEKELQDLNERLANKERENKERVLLERLVVTSDIQFNKGVPINAPILFKSIEYWDSFGIKKSTYPQRMTKAIRQVVEKSGQSIKTLSFWLSNLCVFYNLVIQEYPLSKQDEKAYKTPFAVIVKDMTTVFGDYKLSLVATKQTEDEFKIESPVTQFKQDVSLLLSTSFAKILTSLYIEIMGYVVPSMFEDVTVIEERRVRVTASNLIKIFSQYSQLLSSNGVFAEVVNQFFAQVYYFVNASVVNAMMHDGKYSTMGNSIMLKMSVTQLENWAQDNKFDMARSQLEGLRQITNVLMMNKNMLIDENIRKDICPILTIAQISKILSYYHADEYDPEASISPTTINTLGNEVPKQIEELMVFEPVIKKIVEMPSWRLVDVPKSLANQDGYDFLFDKKK